MSEIETWIEIGFIDKQGRVGFSSKEHAKKYLRRSMNIQVSEFVEGQLTGKLVPICDYSKQAWSLVNSVLNGQTTDVKPELQREFTQVQWEAMK